MSDDDKTYEQQLRDRMASLKLELLTNKLSTGMRELIVDEINEVRLELSSLEPKRYDDPDYDPFDWPF